MRCVAGCLPFGWDRTTMREQMACSRLVRFSFMPDVALLRNNSPSCSGGSSGWSTTSPQKHSYFFLLYFIFIIFFFNLPSLAAIFMLRATSHPHSGIIARAGSRSLGYFSLGKRIIYKPSHRLVTFCTWFCTF